MKRSVTLSALLVAFLMLFGVVLTGCESTGARPAALTGQEDSGPVQHERYDTGIESQANDM